MLKIIVTGPESSGKTTLCEELSKHFNFPFSKEYAREYLEKINKDYNQDDLLKIAKGQLKSEQNMQLLDTDLITIKIWSEYKYGNCDSWIIAQIEKQKSEKRFYLLCSPDIPWQADTQRENPHNRNRLLKMYSAELSNVEHPFFFIEGQGSKRLKNAIKIVDEINLLQVDLDTIIKQVL